MTNQQGAPEALRAHFEALASDPSFKLRRSSRGTYVNPAVARDWKWFQLGARYSQPSASAEANDPQLLKFYAVSTDAELIAAQARHIERLQAKLPQTPSLAPQRARKG